MATGRILIPNGTRYPSHVDGIINALTDGYRHLVFTQPDVPFDKTLDLDSLLGPGSHNLRFDGGPLHGVNFQKSQSLGGPMIKRTSGSLSNDEISLYWDGITLQGMGNTELAHGMQIAWLDRAYFTRCAFREFGAYGLSLGDGGNASAVVFSRCEFTENRHGGLALVNTRDFVINEMSFFHRNAVAGQGHPDLYLHDAASHTNNEYGFGLIEGCLFERDNLGTGLLVGKARRLRVVGNRWVLSQIETQSTTVLSYFGWNSANPGASLLKNLAGSNNVREHNDP